MIALALAFVAGVIATLAVSGMIQHRRERQRREQLAADRAQDETMRRRAFVSHEIAVAVLARGPTIAHSCATPTRGRDGQPLPETEADMLEAEAAGAGFFPEPSGAPPMSGPRLNRPLYFRNAPGSGTVGPA